MKKIGFIGAGNMGGAMCRACAKLTSESVFIYDVNTATYEHYRDVENIVGTENIKELVDSCDYIVLSIKPQYYGEVLAMLKGNIKPNQIIITVAPSYCLKDIKDELGETVKVIRTMPNTPALIGSGITAYCYEKIEEDELKDFYSYFNSFGKLIKVEEKLMPAVVATTGSSPAYAYLFIEAMADAAVSFGMPRQMAYEMAAGALKGSAEMVLETGKHPGELKDNVTSPGGTTIKAVIAMEESGFRNSVIKGMEACYKQVIDMSK